MTKLDSILDTMRLEVSFCVAEDNNKCVCQEAIDKAKHAIQEHYLSLVPENEGHIEECEFMEGMPYLCDCGALDFNRFRDIMVRKIRGE